MTLSNSSEGTNGNNRNEFWRGVLITTLLEMKMDVENYNYTSFEKNLYMLKHIYEGCLE